MRDVEKALQPKTRTDPATVLHPEYHDFLDVFSQTEADKLPPHRDADHRIELGPGKVPPYGPFDSMSQDDLKVLQKFLDKNLEKGFIRPSKSSAAFVPLEPLNLDKLMSARGHFGVGTVAVNTIRDHLQPSDTQTPLLPSYTIYKQHATGPGDRYTNEFSLKSR